MNKPDPCILILHRNTPIELINLLKQIKNQTYKNYHILIIDDNSNAESNNITSQIDDSNVSIIPYQGPWKFGVSDKYDFGLRIANLLVSVKVFFTLIKVKNSGEKWHWQFFTLIKVTKPGENGIGRFLL